MMYVCICVYYIERWSGPNQSAQCIRIDKRHIFKNAKKKLKYSCNSELYARAIIRHQSSIVYGYYNAP